MTNVDLGALLSRIEADGVVTADEIIEMRRCIWNDNMLTVIEADALFRINDNCQNKPVEWSDFFITGMTDFLVRQTMPRGYIDEANAAWLMQRISHDGVCETYTEMALLMNVLKHAESVTPRLEHFALEQVKQSVLHSKGILARSGSLTPGAMGEAEVEIIKGILYACGSAGGNWITRDEAELLFDLSDATANANNHASWQDLFVAAIANHLMMLGNTDKVDMSEALRREKWLAETNKGISWNIGNAFKAWLGKTEAPKMTYSILDDAGAAQAERITESEAQWLINRLNRDGKLSDDETALLKFLKEDCPDIHESLQPLLSSAA